MTDEEKVAYERGRADERADVLAWIDSLNDDNGWFFTSGIEDGKHVGAVERERVCRIRRGIPVG